MERFETLGASPKKSSETVEIPSPGKMETSSEVETLSRTETGPETSYHFPEIMEKIVEGMSALVTQLKESIDRGEYNTLICDDIRGRVLTMILRDFIRAKAPNGHKIQTYFLALGKGKRDPEADTPQKFIERKKDSLGKGLIVTEYVDQGSTIRRASMEFDQVGYTNYDVATMGSARRDYNVADLRKFHAAHKLFVGKAGLNINLLKSKGVGYTRLNGTRKDIPVGENYADDYEKRLRTIRGAHALRVDDHHGLVPKARADMKIAAQKIMDQVWGAS